MTKERFGSRGYGRSTPSIRSTEAPKRRLLFSDALGVAREYGIQRKDEIRCEGFYYLRSIARSTYWKSSSSAVGTQWTGSL